jgi:sugar/nucleoside kinase (ribokinase family)
VNLLPAWPQQHGPLAKLRIREQLLCNGGQTATAMATCAALGLRAGYVGAIGSDENGRSVHADLLGRGVDVSAVVVRETRNQSAIILVDDRSGERTVMWHRDERLAIRPSELPASLLAAARLVHVDDVDQPAALEAARIGRARGIPVTSDLDRRTEATAALVAAVTIPIFAEHLTLELTGESDQERALRKLRRQHDGLLVVTLGPLGAAFLDGDRFEVVPGFAVDAVDTTGSGDVFRGGFIFGWLSGWAVPRIVRFANAAAAVSCTRLGALNSVPRPEEIEELIRREEAGTHPVHG